MIIFFFLVLKQAKDQQQRAPEVSEGEYEEEGEEQEAAVRELLESLNIKVEGKLPKVERKQEKAIPPPLPEGMELPEVKMPEEKFAYEGVEKDKRLIEKGLRQTWKRPKTPALLSKFGYGEKEVFRTPHKGSRVTSEELQPHHEEAFQILKRQQSRVRQTIRELDSFKDAVIIREILGPPKGLE